MVLRFNAEGPDGLLDRKAPGATAKLNAARQAIRVILESGPVPSVHGVMRWRPKDLAQWIYEELAITLDESTVGQELRAVGFLRGGCPRTLHTTGHHA